MLATTHDLPPLAGYLAGRDLELRASLDPSPRAPSLPQALQVRSREREALVETLRDEGDLPAAPTPVDDAALAAAVNVHLARTPARLVAVGLDDLAGETEPLNLPGVPVQRHRSWSRRMQRTLDEIAADPRVRALLPDARVGRRATRSEEPR